METAAETLQPVDLAAYIEEQDTVPYPKEKANLMELFYKKRAKNPQLFTYNEQGNLEVRSKTGAVEDTIILQTFVPHPPEIREVLDQSRLDALGAAEEQYEIAVERFRKAKIAYENNGEFQSVLAAQKAATEADRILSRVRYGTRGIQAIPNPDSRQVLFENYYGARLEKSYEERKLFSATDPLRKELYRLSVFELPVLRFYGSYVDSPDEKPGQDVEAPMEEPGLSDGDSRQKLRDGRWARIFFDVEGPNGFVSPFWPADITVDAVLFMSAFQAFEYFRASEAGQEGLKQNILRTRSIRRIRSLTDKFQTQPKDVPGLWLRIFTSLYQQHPELKEKLLKTGTDALVFADVRQSPSGTGVGPRTRECLDPSLWTGENAVGFALETLRYQFREGTAKEAARDTAPTESVITVEEQERAKVGAIIGARKKFFPKRA